jgi:hypothetical protein
VIRPPPIGRSDRYRQPAPTLAKPIPADTVGSLADKFARLLDDRVGAALVATLVTDPRENNYPRASTTPRDTTHTHRRFERSPGWRDAAPAIGGGLTGAPVNLRLAPRARSRLA